ncbi:MAG: hypothetical protein ACK5KO_01850 [Arachnia sp.]
MSAASRATGAALVAMLIASQGASLAAAADIEPPEFDAEMTGLAWDADQEQLFVVADQPESTVMALDAQGQQIGQIGFVADVQSPQGLALFDGSLYFGDIGDAERDREYVTVYRIEASVGDQPHLAWDFDYPEGAQDAKALAVSGRGRIYIVTAGDDAGIYSATLEPSRNAVNELTRVADAPVDVSDAVFAEDGFTLLMRTADGVQAMDMFEFETTSLTTYVGAHAGESLTTYSSGRMLVGSAALLRDEPVPAGDSTVTPSSAGSPSASPSPTEAATQSPTASPTATPTDGPATQVSVNRRGTLLSLAGAAAVALLAGVAVFVSGSRRER